MNSLARNALVSLLRFQSELHAMPSSQVDERFDFLQRVLCRLTRSRRVMSLVMLKEPSSLVSKVQRINTQIAQWRPYLHMFHNYDEESLRVMSESAQARELGEDAELASLCNALHDQGRHMTYRASKDVELFRAMDTLYPGLPYRDRLMGVHAYSSQIELYIMADRLDEDEPFSAEDEEVLGYMVEMVTPLMYHLCLSHGLLVNEGMEALTPRERETLIMLLGALTEKEMAQEMGLTPRSMHQYVLKVYGKLNINSRAELSSLWLDVPAMSA